MMMSIPSKLSDCKPEGEGEVPCSNDSQTQTVVNELKSVSPKSSSPPPLKRQRIDVKGKGCLCITNLLSLTHLHPLQFLSSSFTRLESVY